MSDNSVTFCGTLTRDPELRFTQGGRAVCNFGLAVNRRYQQNNEWVEDVAFFNGVAWAAIAENISACLVKGNRVVVTGRMQTRQYETQQGDKRTAVEIVVDDIGASLKWATVQIEKTERNTGNAGRGGGGDSGGYADDPGYDGY